MSAYPVPIAFGLTLAMAATGIAAAQVPVEWLAPTDGATLEVVESERTEQRVKTVYLGRGETAENWTRRITVWSYRRPPQSRADFADWATRIRQEIIADCPDVRASELRLFDWSGRAAAEFLIVCPLYPATGRPDIYLARSISGDSGLLAAAVTFRRAPTEVEAAAARSYLDTLRLCTAATASAICR